MLLVQRVLQASHQRREATRLMTAQRYAPGGTLGLPELASLALQVHIKQCQGMMTVSRAQCTLTAEQRNLSVNATRGIQRLAALVYVVLRAHTRWKEEIFHAQAV